jgi:hypothetical protein
MTSVDDAELDGRGVATEALAAEHSRLMMISLPRDVRTVFQEWAVCLIRSDRAETEAGVLHLRRLLYPTS